MKIRLGIAVLGLAASLLASAELNPTVAIAAGPITLKPDAPVFWHATQSQISQSPMPKCPARYSPCADFAVATTEKAARLRVAIDTPGRTDGEIAVLPGFTGEAASRTKSPRIELFDAKGKSITAKENPFSVEAFIAKPGKATYFVRASGVDPSKVRLRAKLESAVPAVAKSSAALLPNLQLIPPYEMTFASTTGPVAEGKDPMGCNPYEQTEYGCRRALRFSIGPQNVGEGPLMLSIKSEVVQGLLQHIPVKQKILHANGTVTTRSGGYSIFHKTHAHYHHNGFGTLELLKVLDPSTGELVAAGAGPKQGFCMLDYKVAQWEKFNNVQAGQTRQDCTFTNLPGSETQLGLGVGWGDLYVYHLDGNYVEFGDNSDGLYVVRSIADAFNQVQESVETDNAGYTYIRVTGKKIEVLERGRGYSPWDPAKVVVNRSDNMRYIAPVRVST